MLKIFQFFLPLCILLHVSSADLHAQDWQAGAAYTRGLEKDNGGINLRAYRDIGSGFSLGGELTYLYPHEYYVGHYFVSDRTIEYAVNLHYNIDLTEKLTLYPLAGANIVTRLRKSTDIRGNTTDRLSKGGLSFGAGVFYEFNIYRPFLEFRHNINELGQPQLFIGATIKLFSPEKDIAE